ncbi:hypothetical protein D3C74_447280 [compost metagenome]
MRTICKFDLPQLPPTAYKCSHWLLNDPNIPGFQKLPLLDCQHIRPACGNNQVFAPVIQDFGHVEYSRLTGHHDKRLIPQLPAIAVGTVEKASPIMLA